MTAVQRDALRVRTIFVFAIATAALYVLVFTAYVGLRVGPGAAELRRGAEPIQFIFHELHQRSSALDSALAAARGDIRASGRAGEIRASVHRHESGVTPRLFAPIPEDMRVVMARSDVILSRLENVLLEVASLIELGRFEEAMARRAVADSLRDLLSIGLGEAERLGLQHLVNVEEALAATAEHTVAALLWWLAVGAVVFPALVVFVLRRLSRPLAALEAGLDRVADGDLDACIPVRRLDELGRLAEQFNEMTRVLRLRAGEQGRLVAAGQLMASVAHEVNNPLMAISAVVSSQLEDRDLPDPLRRDAEQIRRQTQRAGRLVAGLLRFVRPEDGVRTVGLNDVVRRSFDLVAHQFQAHRIELVDRLAHHLPAVRANPSQLEQVFVNLLSNAVDAVRATPGPHRITVQSWSAEGTVFAAVEDTGRGVHPEIAERLFLPFATTKGRKGNGLGLYISRDIARQAGGALGLDPGRGQGARFVLSLPAAGPTAVGSGPREEPARAPVQSGAVEGLTILLLEDEPAIRGPMRRYLEKRGAEVVEAEDGNEGLLRLAHVRPDVILADVQMPGMNGVEFYRALCSDHPDLSERLLFLSGDISQLEEWRAEIAADRVLVKPVQLTELTKRIRAIATEGPRLQRTA